MQPKTKAEVCTRQKKLDLAIKNLIKIESDNKKTIDKLEKQFARERARAISRLETKLAKDKARLDKKLERAKARINKMERQLDLPPSFQR